MKKRLIAFALLMILSLFTGVSMGEERQEGQTVIDSMPHIMPGQLASEKSVYIDSAGDMVIVPKDLLYPFMQMSRPSLPAWS